MTNTNPLSLGTILVSLWGYDQTNVDYYEVTAVTPATVQIRQIRAERTGERNDTVSPKPGDFYGEPMRRKVLTYGSEPFVRVNDVANAYPWRGHPHTATDWH